MCSFGKDLVFVPVTFLFLKEANFLMENNTNQNETEFAQWLTGRSCLPGWTQ